MYTTMSFDYVGGSSSKPSGKTGDGYRNRKGRDTFGSPFQQSRFADVHSGSSSGYGSFGYDDSLTKMRRMSGAGAGYGGRSTSPDRSFMSQEIVERENQLKVANDLLNKQSQMLEMMESRMSLNRMGDSMSRYRTMSGPMSTGKFGDRSSRIDRSGSQYPPPLLEDLGRSRERGGRFRGRRNRSPRRSPPRGNRRRRDQARRDSPRRQESSKRETGDIKTGRITRRRRRFRRTGDRVDRPEKESQKSDKAVEEETNNGAEKKEVEEEVDDDSKKQVNKFVEEKVDFGKVCPGCDKVVMNERHYKTTIHHKRSRRKAGGCRVCDVKSFETYADLVKHLQSVWHLRIMKFMNKNKNTTFTFKEIHVETPEYDSNISVGCDMINEQSGIYCDACENFYPAAEDYVANHLSSRLHYDNWVNYVRILKLEEVVSKDITEKQEKELEAASQEEKNDEIKTEEIEAENAPENTENTEDNVEEDSILLEETATDPNNTEAGGFYLSAVDLAEQAANLLEEEATPAE